MKKVREMATPNDPIRKPGPSAPEYQDTSASKFGFEPNLAADNARQGVTGHGVRLVLGFGIAGALIAFLWLIYWVY
jgi:hypothetical protein